jgi:N-acetylmuramoyl-L-alanine amidase
VARRLPVLALVLALLLAACSESGAEQSATSTTVAPTTTTTAAAPEATAPPETTTSTTQVPLPAAPTDGPVRALVTPTGVVVAASANGDGTYRVTTPCDRTVTITGGTPIHGATVVLDPGHGGVETGSSGENGVIEKDLNMAVAQMAKASLEAQGATVVLTRTADYRVTLQSRAALVQSLQPPVFISIHHNGGHDGPLDKPGTEMYYQHASPSSKRLAGILYEEIFSVYAGFDGISWHGNVDAGAKYRLNSEGGDYYGILRRTGGVTSVLSEALFLSAHLSEAELLARPEVQQAQADAIARAVRRFMLSDDAGSGFTEPIPRTTPAGPGGGGTGCEDPPLV